MQRISELPPEYQELAKARRSEDELTSNAADYLESAFYWGNTPEGDDWWAEVRTALFKEVLPPIPKGSLPPKTHRYWEWKNLLVEIYSDFQFFQLIIHWKNRELCFIHKNKLEEK